jgi:CRISPR-associated protein Cas2
MERFGDRVQKSVFECWLRETELRSMREAVEREVKIGTDSLRLYPLCENCRQLAKSAGGLDIDEPNDYTIV